MRLFLVRGKPRDAYDLWLLSKQGVKLDRGLLAAKLSIYADRSTLMDVQEALARAGRDWSVSCAIVGAVRGMGDGEGGGGGDVIMKLRCRIPNLFKII